MARLGIAELPVANGAAAGEGYTTSQVYPGLDRGDSIFDFRHRLVLNYVWQLPGYNMNGAFGTCGWLVLQWNLGPPERTALGDLFLPRTEAKGDLGFKRILYAG